MCSEDKGGPDTTVACRVLHCCTVSQPPCAPCSLLSESGEREKELERRVEALTRENAELKTQLRQNEGKKEVEGLLWMLMERVGEAETGGARRHNEVRNQKCIHTTFTTS